MEHISHTARVTTNLRKYIFVIFYFMCTGVLPAYISVTCMHVPECQKRDSELLEMVLQALYPAFYVGSGEPASSPPAFTASSPTH